MSLHFHQQIVPFIYFFLCSLVLGGISAKTLLCEISEILLSMFSTRTFMVSWFKFKSFIHFEFSLVYSISWWSRFIFLHVAVQIFQHHLLKMLFLFHFILLPLCEILIDQRDLGLFLGSLPLVYVSIFLPVPYCFEYSGLVI